MTNAAGESGILAVAADLLERDGYEAFQLRDVAKSAAVSLRTVYKHYPSRDDLVVAAVEQWMAINVYRPLPKARDNEDLATTLVRAFRHLFAPWKKHPTMLTVFLRAALLPGGERLGKQGAGLAGSAIAAYFDGYDPKFARDVQTVLTYLTTGLMNRVAVGDLDVTAMMRVYETAVRRLTAGVSRS